MLPGSRERGAEAGAPWGDPLQLAEVPADRGPALAHPRARPLPALPSGPAHFPATCPRVALSSPSTSCHSRSPHPNTPALRDGDRVVLALHSERKLVLLTELTRLAL